jgi:hypothetical protein
LLELMVRKDHGQHFYMSMTSMRIKSMIYLSEDVTGSCFPIDVSVCTGPKRVVRIDV